ncbi:MAG TPA: phosphatidate cytidylyltransferase [Anaerolineae bacterium]|nr:phosphatidate cytidylyltransferase [Anaerolineae bacterium]
MLIRTISAFILLPIAIGLIWLGGAPFTIALSVLLGVAAYEFNQLVRQGDHPHRAPLLFSLALVALSEADALYPHLGLLRPGIALILIASLAWQLRHRQAEPTVDWALAIAGGLYLGIAGAHFILLRQLPDGERWLLLTLTGTWLADSGAYLIGSRLGRHKMTPALSPKKSWEGLIGGMIFGTALNPIVATLFGLSWLHGAALGLIGATIGTLGDLSISMIKRQVGAKDSGHLIPGHGGALDRLDSMLFTAIVGYYYLSWIARLGSY